MAELADRGAVLVLRHSTERLDPPGGIDDTLSDMSDPLDEPPPQGPGLSYGEKKNLLLLCFLYFIHALPLQFSWSTMPIILRQQLGYSDVGTFLISQYPYSWKVAWSPLVDGFFLSRIGRRKTWIVPSFVAAGAIVLWLAFKQDSLVAEITRGKSIAMAWLVLAWFLVMVLCANIRIALDSWSINLLSPPNVHWASPVVTVGETASGLVSFNLFLGMTSLSSPKDEAGKAKPASTWVFFRDTAIAFVATAILLLVGKREDEKSEVKTTVRRAYSIIWRILKLRQVWLLMLVHITSMIGFMTNDTITVLELVKNNFDDFDLAALATVTLPFAVAGGILVTRSFETRHPLHVWRKMFPWRLALALISQVTILFVSKYPDSHFRWLVVFLPYCLSRMLESSMWVSFVAFHAQVSDPEYGGIYMSLLSTTLNIRYDILQFLFTKAIGLIDGSEDLTKPSPLIDGYQIVNLTSVLVSIPVYWFFLKPVTSRLQTMDVSTWRVTNIDSVNGAAYEMVETIETHEHIA